MVTVGGARKNDSGAMPNAGAARPGEEIPRRKTLPDPEAGHE